MARNTLAKADWSRVGPAVIAWLIKTVPTRRTTHGVLADCADVFAAEGVTGERLHAWLTTRADWPDIRQTVGTRLAAGASTSVGKSSLTMKAFALDEKRAVCPVCALPADVRAELRNPVNSEIKTDQRLRYIAAACGATITRAELDAHRNGRHEA